MTPFVFFKYVFAIALGWALAPILLVIGTLFLVFVGALILTWLDR